MDILNKLLIILLIFAFPLGEIARFEYNELAVTLIDIFVGLIALLWIINRKKIPNIFLTKSIIFFVVILIFSLIANTSKLEKLEFFSSSLYIVRWFFYSVIYFVVYEQNKSFKEKISKAMLIGGSLVVIGGFFQYFLYPDLRNLYYAGWDEHLYRMFGSFLDPNFLSVFLVLFLLFVLEKLINSKDRKILVIIFMFSLLAIILTFSRSGYLALGAGVTTFLLLKNQKKILLVFVGLFLVFLILAVKTSLSSEGTNLLRAASNEARLDSAQNAIVIFKDNPILGVGFNSYRYAQRNYGFVNDSERVVHSGAGTDSSFLFVLATSGLVGLFFYALLWFKIISIRKPVIVASAIALLVNSLFINSLFYPFIMLWMWMLIGIKESN